MNSYSIESTQENIYPVIHSALSIDVEDGINILMRDLFNVDKSPTTRVIDNVNILLDLFNEKDVRATFFILGEIATTYPSLVKSIASGGHEIGVHGYNHDQLFKLSPGQVKEDIYKAKEIIEDVTGKEVYGFRAPAFSIMESTSWALDIISELGFKYDSSIVPARANRYGWPGFSREINRLNLKGGGSLIEVPLSVIDVMGKTLPACGGGYLRYFPYSFTRKAFLTISKQRPVIVYLHPYELDTAKYPDYFYEAMASMRLVKRIPLSFYRLNKGTVKKKLGLLIDEFPFKPIIDIITGLEKSSEIAVRSF